MKHLLLWFLVAAALVIGFALYRSHASGSRVNVTPDAGRAIEKARER